MAAPSCSIDFSRGFSLPFGVPSTLVQAGELAPYLAELGAQAQTLYLDRPGRVEHDPGRPAERLLRELTLANDASRSVLLPRTTKHLGSAVEPAAAAIAAVAVASPMAAVPAPPLSLPEVAARRFRWDAHARQVAALPLPNFADESVIIDWPSTGSATSVIGQALPGIIADPASTHLLPAAPASHGGELNPGLLRAPVVGLVRFERYRHFVKAGGTLNVDRPSNAGAVVIQALANAAAMPANAAPIFRKHLVVIEHVAADSAVECLGTLAWCQLIRRADIEAQPALKKQWATAVTWLLSSWLAYLSIARAGHRPASADPLPNLPAAERAPFEQGFQAGAGPVKAPTPSRAAMETFIDRVLTTNVAEASLLDYVRTVFAPIVCGASWKELGIELPVDPSARPAASKRAHRVLESLATTSETWLPCFAGCPVGAPARFYDADGAAVTRRALYPLERLTTFDLEALQISEWIDLTTPDITTPALPDRFHAPALAAYDALPGGRLAAFRVVDIGGGDQELFTADWLGICTKGSNARGRFAAPLDFGAFAAAGHPLAAVVGWADFQAAAAARTRLDDLRDADVQGRNVRVAKANLDWWVVQTNIAVAAKWPATLPGVGAQDTPPTPANPFGFGATNVTVAVVQAQLNEPSGFDEYDLEAALTARGIVRNGRTLLPDLELALVLAVLDREGLKSVGGFERTGLPRRFGLNAGMGAWGAADFLDFAVQNWLIFPFGLDLLVLANTANANGHPFVGGNFDAGFATRFRATLQDMGQRYLTAGILPAAAEPAVGPQRMLAALRRRRRRNGPIIDLVTRSRSALALGVVLQQATFQWVHQRLSLATRARHAPTPNPDDFAWVQVAELTGSGTPPPPPGAGANSAERRRYLAYWGLVYLAFNTSPPTWNAWVNAVPDAAIAAGTSVGEYLVYHRNADPAALEPAGPGRTRGQRGNMLRFVAGLDAYLRMGIGQPAADQSDPATRGWPVP